MRLRGIVLFVLLALVVGLGATSASAGRRVIITGGGWGHGIGMSQYGAYGRALKGHSAERILEHYYSGAQVSKRDAANIRVGLLQGRSTMRFEPRKFRDGGGRIVFRERRVGRIAQGTPGSNFRVELSSTGGVRIYKNGNLVKQDGRRVFGSAANPVYITYEKHGSMVFVDEKNNSYAYGRLEIGPYQASSCGSNFCLRLVVALSMQKYLYGLGEVPSSWPQSSLRSQAIAGRTYAFEKIQRLGQNRQPCGCAVYDSVIDQAYIGDAKRTGSGSYWDDWKGAVDATNDQIIVYNGDPIQALYSSSSGGHTEHNENVWGSARIPYLRGVPDGPDDVAANPNHTWKVVMSWRAFKGRLENYFNEANDGKPNLGRLQKFRLVKPFGVSGRVTVVKSRDRGGVRLVGTQNVRRVDGWTIRSVLGLKDTLFRIRYRTTSN